jgi:hypothetical protein
LEDFPDFDSDDDDEYEEEEEEDDDDNDGRNDSYFGTYQFQRLQVIKDSVRDQIRKYGRPTCYTSKNLWVERRNPIFNPVDFSVWDELQQLCQTH